MRRSALSAREADVFACLLDTVVPPAGPLPPPARTDAVGAFDRMLASVPALNRIGLRAMLWVAELSPRFTGPRRRLRQLDAAQRAACLDRLERGPLAQPVEALLALTRFAYYGDAGVMGALGYDADSVVARGRAVRAAEGRW
jgi:hypothetical protein